MKKTRFASLYPLNKGLDTNSVAGTQDPRSFTRLKNAVLGPRPSLRKRPGQRRIPYIGQDDGTQAAAQLFGTVASGQFSEIVRVRKGRVEALRDISGSAPQFVDLGLAVSPSDTVCFERFGNALILTFENTEPHYYTVGGTLAPMPLPASINTSPPRIFRRHDFRLWFSGRRANPHTVYAMAPNSISDMSLFGGGFSMRINDGDGDPEGITALSPVFRKNIYAMKWMQCYEIYRSGYGYGWQGVSDQFGAVHHNCVAATSKDLFSIDVNGWQSLQQVVNTGGGIDASLSLPIYEYFQESVNWSAYRSMVLVYDKPTATLLLSYPKGGSSTPNAVMGMNVFTRQFFEWEDIEYPAIGRYFDFGRERTFVADTARGICVLDPKETTLVGDPIAMEAETGTVFPTGQPQNAVSFTEAWLLCKPTDQSVKINVSYSIDAAEIITQELDTIGGGYGATIAELETSDYGGIIGVDEIGKMHEDMAVIPFRFEGDGSSVKFKIEHDGGTGEQPVEIYGIAYRFDYNEDFEEKKTQ